MIPRVLSVENTDPDAAAAIVIRPSLTDTQGPSAAVSARPQEGSRFSARVFDAADGNGTQTFPLSNLPDGPVWLRLERRGNRIVGYVGPDGVTWAPMQHVIYDDLPEDVFIGLAVTSANNGELATAVFSDVQISNRAPQELVIDDFDDGDLTTNTSGVGSGFTTYASNNGAEVTEAGGKVLFSLPFNGGRRAAITSVDAAAINTVETSRFEFNEINLPINAANTGTGDTDRVLFGVSNFGSADDTGANPHPSFYIQVEADGIATGAGNTGFNGTSVLFFESVDDTRTILATWEFDGLDFSGAVTNSTPLSFVFDITESTYSLSISGDTISNLAGSLSGNFTHGLDVGYANVFAQVEGPGINPEIGQVVITEATAGVLGDFDADGDVDLADLDQYNGNIGAAAAGDLADPDLDGDGFVGANDFAQHYETLVETSNGNKGTFAGDLNLDGMVDVLGDAFALVSNLGTSVSSWADGDVNGDGTVDVLGDAFRLVGNLGMSNGSN